MAKKKKKSSFRTEQRFDPIFHSSERGERGISLFFEMRRLDRRIEVKRTPPSLPRCGSKRSSSRFGEIRREESKGLNRVSSRARTHALGFQGNPFAFRLLGTVYVRHSIRTNLLLSDRSTDWLIDTRPSHSTTIKFPFHARRADSIKSFPSRTSSRKTPLPNANFLLFQQTYRFALQILRLRDFDSIFAVR